MELHGIPMVVTDWESVEPVEHIGERGPSVWRSVEAGPVRIRVVDYSPGYRADHWCPRGHVILILEGEFSLSFKDGQSLKLGPGMSFVIGDDERNPHLGFSEGGAKAYIID
ncbi:MAG: DHCW motif cupin fold protein [Acidobacteriota bacterium]